MLNQNRRSFGVMAASAAIIGVPAALKAGDWDTNSSAKGALSAGVAFQYVGRAALNFISGTGVIYGYLTTLQAAPSGTSLFAGAPSEKTALLTLRADVSFQAIAGNGDLGGGQFAVLPILIAPGPFQIYYTPRPNHDWSNPDSFSNGHMVAGFERDLEQMAISGPISINAASAALRSTSPFWLDNRAILDFREITPKEVTNVTTASSAALAGSTPVAPIFAFAGYTLAIGR